MWVASGDTGCEPPISVSDELGIHRASSGLNREIPVLVGACAPSLGGPVTSLASNIFLLTPLDQNQQRSILGPLKENSGGQVAASEDVT